MKALISLFVVVVGGLVSVGAVRSTTPGANGLIVYGREVSLNHLQLFTIRPDGTGRRQITRGSTSSLQADWAPNGRSIVYEIDRDSGAAIAIRAYAGGGARVLTPTGFQGNPSFSPDGRWIAYVREARGNGIWLMRANGTGLRRLTRNPFAAGVHSECGCDEDPNFSPDGKFVSFVRIRQAEKRQALFVVRRNGTGLRQLTPYSWEVGIKHDWSPDGKLILLTTNADFVTPGESANMVTIRPDGSGKTELTHFEGGSENAFAGSFSPDGKHIVFRLEVGLRYSLAVADRDGDNIRLLTTDSRQPRGIDWGTYR